MNLAIINHGTKSIYFLADNFGDDFATDFKDMFTNKDIDFIAHCIHDDVLNLFNCENEEDWKTGVDPNVVKKCLDVAGDLLEFVADSNIEDFEFCDFEQLNRYELKVKLIKLITLQYKVVGNNLYQKSSIEWENKNNKENELLKISSLVINLPFLNIGEYGSKDERFIKEDICRSYKVDISVVDSYDFLIIYSLYDYSSESFFLLRRKSDGKLFENHASHCSCYGYEGQFEPKESSIIYLTSKHFKSENCRDKGFKIICDFMQSSLFELLKAMEK